MNLRKGDRIGQFVFPRSVLVKEGIISIPGREGKRAFRVYPSWDLPASKQAQRSQKLQSDYFFLIDKQTDLRRVRQLYALALA